jgi:hypothetical protein
MLIFETEIEITRGEYAGKSAEGNGGAQYQPAGLVLEVRKIDQ